MEKKLYSIKDTVADEFSQPFYANNDDVCKRIVSNSFLSSKDVVYHAVDYSIYRLGSFDLQSGSLSSSLSFICNCSDLITTHHLEPTINVSDLKPEVSDEV